MLFLTPGAIQKILLGRKTVTRRPAVEGKPCRYQVGGGPGGTYAVQPGRGKPAVARIRIVSLEIENWPFASGKRSFKPEAEAEGFENYAAFREAYAKMNGREALASPCWRIKFELVEEAPTGRQE